MSQEHTEPTLRRRDFTDVDRETDTILKARIEPSTRGTYANGNIRFMIWLYDQSHTNHKYDHLLQPVLLDAMVTADSQDRQTITTRGAPSKAQTHLRALCRSSLLDIKSESECTHPIKLAKLDFRVFSRYLATFKKKHPKEKVWPPRWC